MIDEDHHKCELLKKGANYLKWLMWDPIKSFLNTSVGESEKNI